MLQTHVDIFHSKNRTPYVSKKLQKMDPCPGSHRNAIMFWQMGIIRSFGQERALCKKELSARGPFCFVTNHKPSYLCLVYALFRSSPSTSFTYFYHTIPGIFYRFILQAEEVEIKNKWLTDDQIYSLSSPSVTSQITSMNNIPSKEKAQVDWPAHSLHTVVEGNDSDLLSQRFAKITSLFPFKSFHDRAESSEVTSGGHLKPTVFPDCWHYDSKKLSFLLTTASLGIDIRVASSQTWSHKSRIIFRWNCQKLIDNDVYATYFSKTHSDNFLCHRVI